MNIETVGVANLVTSRANEPKEQVERKQQISQENTPSSSEEESKLQSEELINQIRALTEDGLYSVRFEKDSGSDELIVKIIDQDTEEIIRQIPPEELLSLSEHLKNFSLSGGIVDTTT
ncbi:flagellar protein FlaG [Desulfobulbus rhabdoformis]|jgi:flagellar protein FlaG|uniref:flagellar protein FlaG n=1 Tax=Desulfobulbus rhabdoformis TaxID=34032 RepID=UPI0019637F96|nr:flagellar protein FlaG [Desulfobulbus rhabdoformis]MBM9616910.1 flagellar protein FlaG [Desulfobulbus rhabdoformis]